MQQRSGKLAFSAERGIVRFIVSLILFAVSAVMIAAGMLIHSVFLPPATMTQSITLDDPAPMTVIDTTSLNRISSTQTISVQGGASGTVYTENPDGVPTATPAESERVVLAWGRKSDVLAFIGNVSYQEIVARGEEGTLVAKKVVGTDVATPDPAGSDLWIEEFEAEQFLARDVTTPKGSLLVIATDGALPAPKSVIITWKMDIDNSVPTNLFYGGLILATVGGLFYYLGWWTDRRKHRHRQGRMPRRPRPPRWRPARTPLAPKRRHGRRALPFIAIVLALPVALSGCSIFPSPVVAPIPSSPAAPRGVAVTAEQVDLILTKLRATLADADEQRAENVAATRLDGAALRFRVAQYKVQRQDKDLGATFDIPEGRVRLLLPQRTTEWPRSVFAVIDDAAVETAPSVAVVLTQATPRDNYKVSYSVALEPGAVIPSVAAAESGAAVIRGETELLSVTPAQAVEQYGDLLINGEKSPYFDFFDPDSLQDQIGAKSKAKRARALGKTAKFSWKDVITEDVPLVFATADAGGIVAVTLQESETVKPASAGAAITATGAVKILAGVTSSMKGIQADYQYQLLFYIPALGSSEKIRLLGYSYALTSARRLGR
jgi:hypothetical protein